MAAPILPNGTYNPKRVHGSGIPLTEYSANPLTTPSEQSHASASVPPEFLLPDGYPDVSVGPVHVETSAEGYIQYLRLILTSRVYDVVKETPLTTATNLSNRLECKVLLKREDLQPVFSFKLRGAYNKMAHMDPKNRWKGVVACSAGD